MNIRSRNKSLILSYLFFIPSIAVYFYSLLSYIQIDNPLKEINLANIIIWSIFLAANLIASLIIFNNFKNTYSIEIFYFILFLNASSLYTFQSLIPILFLTQAASPFVILATKFVFFAHLLSLVYLFFIAFFKTSIEVKTPEIFAAVAIALGILFTGMQPVDVSQYQTLLEEQGHIPSPLILTTMGQKGFFIFLSSVFAILTFAANLISYFQTTNKFFLFQSATLLLISISLNLILFQTPLAAQITGLILYLIGVPLFAFITHHQYKWI